MLQDLTFHHIGIASRNINTEIPIYEEIGYTVSSKVFSDPLLGIKCVFMEGTGPRIEIVMPQDVENHNVLDSWLNKGVKMYHLAFITSDLDITIEKAKLTGGKIVVPPTPAVAFDGRNISFIIFRNMSLIEYIES